jgi:hypothetical protein
MDNCCCFNDRLNACSGSIVADTNALTLALLLLLSSDSVAAVPGQLLLLLP